MARGALRVAGVMLGLCSCVAARAQTPVGRPLDPVANVVLGQPDFVTTASGVVNAGSLNGPTGIASFEWEQQAGCLAVADTGNNRVLIWRAPPSSRSLRFQGGQAASIVLGQPDFTSHAPNTGGIGPSRFNRPYGVHFNQSLAANWNRLAVADTGNNRVLFYRPEGAGERFVYESVIGQPDGSTKRPLDLMALDKTTLNHPKDVSDQFIADFGNHRLLELPGPPGTSDRPRNEVVSVAGQEGFYNSSEWNRGGVGPGSLAFPRAVVQSRNMLFVADFDNHRVLGYTFTPNGWEPQRVIGQRGDFHSRAPNRGGVGARSLCYPTDMAIGPTGELYVADMGNHRVLRFQMPLDKDPAAVEVLGQKGDFTTRQPNKAGIGADTLCFPTGLALDETGNLCVTDTGNNRVLIFRRKGGR